MFEVSLNPSHLPWVIYAIGQGEGPLARAMAIATLAAVGRQVIVLTNSPYALYAQNQISQNPDLESQVSIQSVPVVGSAGAKEDAVLHLEQLCSIAPFVLIVDALPDGFYQELADVLHALKTIPKILILRDLLTQSAIACDLENLIETHYDLAIAPGLYETPAAVKQLSLDRPIEQTPPWLNQSLPIPEARLAARTAMGLEPAVGDRPIICVIASEDPGERSAYSYLCVRLVQQCPQVIVRCLSRLPPENCPLEIWHQDWPATNCLPAADLVIGAGDYTTVYACQSMAIPLIAFPWTRQDDLQRQRLDQAVTDQKSPIKIVTSAEAALASVLEFLNESLHQSLKTSNALARPTPLLVDGAQAAFNLIETAIARKWHQAAQTAMENSVSQLRRQVKEQRFDSRQELW